MAIVRRVFQADRRVFPPPTQGAPWDGVAEWPCRWITAPDATPPAVVAFRCHFTLPAELTTKLHVSADERYRLFLDGEPIGRGPERGDRATWHYETYELTLPPGEHVLVAQVWALGPLKPWAQASVRPFSLLLCPEDPAAQQLFGTGVAAWDAKPLPGYSFRTGPDQVGDHIGVGPSFDLDCAALPWDFPLGQGDHWRPATHDAHGNNGFWLYVQAPVRWLTPAELPPMRDDPAAGFIVRHASLTDTAPAPDSPIDPALHLPKLRAELAGLLRGRPLTVPPGKSLRALIDFDDYLACYPRLTLSGGASATVHLAFAESLTASANPRDKANRDEIDHKFFRGFGDRYALDGHPRTLEPLWWRCGRYVELRVSAGDTPVRLEALEFRRTGYPLDVIGSAAADDPRLDSLLPLCLAGLRACMHETYFDCPFYEQLMYVGDTRLQALLTYALSRDDRLPRKALRTFDATRANPTSLTYANSGPLGQIIPPFSLWWVCMLSDFADYVGDKPFLKSMLPGARAVVDTFLAAVGPDGLCPSLPGWNYVDAAFPGGVPPGGREGEVSPAINLQLVLALDALAAVESYCGEPEPAQRYLRRAAEIMWATEAAFSAGDVLADDRDKSRFSEQTNTLAILTGRLDPKRNERLARLMIESPQGWTRAQLYFTHYLFEAAHRTAVPDLLFSRLPTWYDLQAQGFRALPENTGETRSDCHAWASHPYYHVAASLVGIRPAGPGFSNVSIRPMLGPLQRAAAAHAHPNGLIRVALATDPSHQLVAKIDLPQGLSGTLHWLNHPHPLTPGPQELRLPAP